MRSRRARRSGTDVRIAPAGDAALLVELPGGMDPAASARAVALHDRIRERWPSLRDVVIAYSSLALYFDPLAVDAQALADDVRRLDDGLTAPAVTPSRVIDVPVSYGGDDGPDLAAVAARAALTEAEVVVLHAGAPYRVYMLGFVAGFAYMAPIDPRIDLPRRDTPRERVPAGSVAIAAGQTGIYPSEAPGGWHVIGRTALRPFDPSRGEPFLFRVGDEVRFHPVAVGAHGAA